MTRKRDSLLTVIAMSLGFGVVQLDVSVVNVAIRPVITGRSLSNPAVVVRVSGLSSNVRSDTLLGLTPSVDPWGCVDSTGPGCQGTRAEVAIRPRKSGGKKK